MRACIGLNERGEKQFLAIEDGIRESKQSWKEVLVGLRERRMKEAPKLAIGDGALGFSRLRRFTGKRASSAVEYTKQ